jgi:hypothetical protein
MKTAKRKQNRKEGKKETKNINEVVYFIFECENSM